MTNEDSISVICISLSSVEDTKKSWFRSCLLPLFIELSLLVGRLWHSLDIVRSGHKDVILKQPILFLVPLWHSISVVVWL